MLYFEGKVVENRWNDYVVYGLFIGVGVLLNKGRYVKICKMI